MVTIALDGVGETTINLHEDDVKGMAIGSKLRLSLVPLDHVDTSELDSAYATIADLVDQVKSLGPRAAKAMTMKHVLTGSLLINLGLCAWMWFQ
jgi:hypothetical protein